VVQDGFFFELSNGAHQNPFCKIVDAAAKST